MTDLRDTIAPKSDQLNADDLIGRTLTITVTKVSRCTEPDQPIAINFEGDNRKPYKPCKSMRRVLVKIWGADGTAYVGRRMTLYRDDGVQFGGHAVGGIRISHMSHIDRDMTMALTATRANRKPFTVRPLKDAPQAAPAQARQDSAPPQDAPRAPSSDPGSAAPQVWRIVTGKGEKIAPDADEWLDYWQSTARTAQEQGRIAGLRRLVEANAQAWADLEAAGYASTVQEAREVTGAVLNAPVDAEAA